MPLRQLQRFISVARLDEQPAAIRHGVADVDHQDQRPFAAVVGLSSMMAMTRSMSSGLFTIP